MKRTDKSDREVLAFLFGAGISCKAKLPDTNTITQRILGGSRMHRLETNEDRGRYRLGKCPKSSRDSSSGCLERVLTLLKVIKTEADIYYFGQREANYEDLYFILEQARNSLTFREDNAVANYYAKHLELTIGHLLGDRHADAVGKQEFPPSRKTPFRDSVSTVNGLLLECCNYVRDVVSAMVNPKPKADLSYFRWLSDAVADGDSGQKIFFTLNYDTLVERYFRSPAAKGLLRSGMKLTDGFGPLVESEGVSYFDSKLFDESTCPQLIKLHGSLDWIWNASAGQAASNPLKMLKVMKPDIAGEKFKLDNPLILVGTHNKPTYYSGPLFVEQHLRFHTVLKKSSRLVVCGYSFGDNAINTRVFYWLDQNRSNRACVVHPKPEDCISSARPAAAHFLKQFQESGQIEFVSKKMECVQWRCLKKRLALLDVAGQGLL
jgi:hypothetical protein